VNGYALRELAASIDQELQRRKKDEVKQTQAQIKALAAEIGMSVDEILGHGKKGNGQKSPPKYQHPENPKQTWTGKGRQPGWFKELVDQGKTPEELEIPH
jgi:DNA-binding protein H-NS